jgi:hypothetical protein
VIYRRWSAAIDLPDPMRVLDQAQTFASHGVASLNIGNREGQRIVRDVRAPDREFEQAEIDAAYYAL